MEKSCGIRIAYGIVLARQARFVPEKSFVDKSIPICYTKRKGGDRDVVYRMWEGRSGLCFMSRRLLLDGRGSGRTSRHIGFVQYVWGLLLSEVVVIVGGNKWY